MQGAEGKKSLFESNTILLRPFEPGDVQGLQAILNQTELAGRRQIPWRFPEVAPLSRQQVEEIVQGWGTAKNALNLAVELLISHELAGHAECDWGWDPHCPSVSIVIAPAHQRRGIGSEVLHLLLRYLFEYTPAHNVSCWIADWNEPALRFVEHHQFRMNGRMRRAGVWQGGYYDMVVTDILRPEWLALRGENDAA